MPSGVRFFGEGERTSSIILTLKTGKVRFIESIHLDKGLARAEKIYVEELMQTEDAHEGINAWLQKRKPEWKGK